jgi:hypothetical protein
MFASLTERVLHMCCLIKLCVQLSLGKFILIYIEKLVIALFGGRNVQEVNHSKQAAQAIDTRNNDCGWLNGPSLLVDAI